MKKSSVKAINILKSQSEKIDSLDYTNYKSWQTQTSYYAEQIFGKESDHYNIIRHFSFLDYNSDYSETTQIKAKAKQLKAIVQSFIESIEQYGVKKKEWRHFIMTKNPALFWSIFWGVYLASVALAFWVGKTVTDTAHKSNEATQQKAEDKNQSHTIDLPVKKDSLKPISKPDSIK